MISINHWAKLSPEQKEFLIKEYGLNPNAIEVQIPSKFSNDNLARFTGKKGGTDYLWNELLSQLFTKVEVKEVKSDGEKKEKRKKIKRG